MSYWSDLFPFIVLMAFGMGMTFVPLTLTAVHHLRDEDTGHRLGRAQHHAAGRRRTRPGAPLDPRHPDDHGPAPRQLGAAAWPTPDVASQVFTEGATNAFLLGAIMMLGASLITWIFLNVKHEELATDGPQGRSTSADRLSQRVVRLSRV